MEPSSSVHAVSGPDDRVVQRLLLQYHNQCSVDQEQQQQQQQHSQQLSTVDTSYDDLVDEYERSSGSAFARFRRAVSAQPHQRIRYQTNKQHTRPHVEHSSHTAGSSDDECGSDSDSDSDSSSDSSDGVDERDECLAADGRMKRAMAAVSHTIWLGLRAVPFV